VEGGWARHDVAPAEHGMSRVGTDFVALRPTQHPRTGYLQFRRVANVMKVTNRALI
jgi:hypothetical protein